MKLKVVDVDLSLKQDVKPRNKNIYIKVKDDVLTITTPRLYKDNEIKKIVLLNEQKIYNLYKKANKNKQEKNTVHVFGELYNVRIESDIRAYCKIIGHDLIIHTPINNESQKKNIFKLFLANELKKYVDEVFPTIYSGSFSDIVSSEPDIKYTDVKTYYGKCYPRRKLVYLNINLARYSKLYILSVIYHEMCHFKYFNHQAGFYKLYEERFPKAKTIQHKLKAIKYNDLY